MRWSVTKKAHLGRFNRSNSSIQPHKKKESCHLLSTNWLSYCFLCSLVLADTKASLLVNMLAVSEQVEEHNFRPHWRPTLGILVITQRGSGSNLTWARLKLAQTILYTVFLFEIPKKRWKRLVWSNSIERTLWLNKKKKDTSFDFHKLTRLLILVSWFGRHKSEITLWYMECLWKGWNATLFFYRTLHLQATRVAYVRL